MNEITLEEHLTKREYFAAMAMQGLIMLTGLIEPGDIARMSIGYADALIQELNKND